MTFRSVDTKGGGPTRSGPIRARHRTLRHLVEAQRAIQMALLSIAEESAAPEVGVCIRELLYAATWFCGRLESHLPRGRERGWAAAVARLGLSAERMAELPGFADRLRLINRAQRWMVAEMSALLAEDLAPALRLLFEEASAVYLRSGRRCDEIIAALDRGRDLPPVTG